jgi:hypothetical protein
MDLPPGAGEEAEASPERRRLLELAREVEHLSGREDAKLQRACELVAQLVADGFSPILFCRFIPTVHYVAEALRRKLPDVAVEAVDGNLPPDVRHSRIEGLTDKPRRVLVCTDCLSEGIDLQVSFDAVMHYDLSWNPTRHEQREGRVDRYGGKPQVRALTFYGEDNPVDGIVLEVLLRKHKTIRQQLGILVPIPMDTQVVEQAILQGLLLREPQTPQLDFGFLRPMHHDLDVQWDAAADREKRSRALFAQHPLQRAINDELAREVAEVRRALGGPADVERFTRTVLSGVGATVSGTRPVVFDVSGCPPAIRDAISDEGTVQAVFDGTAPDGAELLVRTHPIVAGLAGHVLESALDPALEGLGRRCGVIRTRAASTRTTLLLVRLRFHIVQRDRTGRDLPLLCEDQSILAFSGSPDRAEWLPPDRIETLLCAQPDANIAAELAREHISRVIDRFELLVPELRRVAQERGDALLDAHRRVRTVARTGVRALRLEVHEPVDVLGIYIYLPAQAGAGA